MENDLLREIESLIDAGASPDEIEGVLNDYFED